MQWFLDLDLWLLLKINVDGANPFFDFIMPVITDLHKNKIFIFLVIPLILFFLLRKKSKKEILRMLATMAVGVILTDAFCGQVLKNLVERKRPPLEHSEVIVRAPVYGNRSFPSNHAANMFCLAFLLTNFNPKWGWPAYLVAFWVAYSRSYVGLHYPSDWLAGALVGTLMAWLSLRFFRRVWP